MLYRTEGIVIRSTDYGEGNKIAVLATKETGKTSVLARGAQKPRSRFAAVTQAFTRGEFVYFRSPSAKVGTLQAAEIIRSHHDVRTDIEKAAVAAYIAELYDRLTPDHEGSSFLFSQLAAALEQLALGKDAEVVAHIFSFHIMREAGYAPSLRRCAFCKREIAGTGATVCLSAQNGGAVCDSCREKSRDGWPVRPKTWKLLCLLQQANLQAIGEINVTSETKAETRKWLNGYVDFHTGIRWKTRDFLEQLEKFRF